MANKYCGKKDFARVQFQIPINSKVYIIMKQNDDENDEKKLLITKTLCQHNVDECMKKVVELQNKLQKAQEQLASRQNSLDIVEKQLNNFYGSVSHNSNFYKKRL